ncbi:MAG: hypothetical protein J7L96_06430, partial [Bacteroidales bacterium]|nr:hypothetical protein [Bacteroidales bacterium]
VIYIFVPSGEIERSPKDLSISPDGTKIYITGSTSQKVLEYHLTTAWDLSTGSYASKSVDVSSKEATPTSVWMNSTGTKFYLLGYTGDAVFTYALSTAWDVSTATYDSQEYSINSQETTVRALAVKPDGSRFYVTGDDNDQISEYNMSTDYNLSTSTYSRSFSISSQDGAHRGMYFRADGHWLCTVGSSYDKTFSYTLSTAWDVSTMSHSNDLSVSTQETSPDAIFFSTNGRKMYILGSNGNKVFQYSLSTAWDLSTGSYASISFDYSSQVAMASGLFICNDGTKLFILDNTTDEIYQYSLSTPWNVSTASYDNVSSVTLSSSSPEDLAFVQDGDDIYLFYVDAVTNMIYRYKVD